MAENISRRKRNDITREKVLDVWTKYPDYNRKQIAAIHGCSEQTIGRRMKGNKMIYGEESTKRRLVSNFVSGLIEQHALDGGLYMYDRRVWVKDAQIG